MGNMACDLMIGQTAIYHGTIVTIVGQPGSSHYARTAARHTCRLGEHCRRYDIDGDDAPWFAWACELRARIAEGQHLDCQAGDTTVRVSCARQDAAYHVQLGHAGQAIAGYGDQFDTEASFASEVEARAYARDLVIGLRAIERGTRTVAPVVEPATTPTPGTSRALDDLVTGHAGQRPAQPVRLAPPARGTHLAMTTTQAAAIVTATDGYVRRGQAGVPGTATTATLTSMARRGWVILDVELQGRRKVVVGARVTPAGERRAAAIMGREERRP